MYIEDRLFSENTKEVLYSVLMDEEELALYSEFQKEFASIRKAVKGANRVIDSAINLDKKAMGKAAAFINRNGLNQNSIKKINSPYFDKITKKSFNHLKKKTGIEVDLAEGLKGSRENAIALAKQNIARGGKAPKLW